MNRREAIWILLAACLWAVPVRAGAPDGYVEVARLVGQVGAPDGFGLSVAFSDQLLAVGAPYEQELRGAVYLFQRPPAGDGPWSLLARLQGVVEDALAALGRRATRALAGCLEALQPRQRQCIVLAYQGGLSHAEVAGEINEPLGSVKSWIRRGLTALKRCLES